MGNKTYLPRVQPGCRRLVQRSHRRAGATLDDGGLVGRELNTVGAGESKHEMQHQATSKSQKHKHGKAKKSKHKSRDKQTQKQSEAEQQESRKAGKQVNRKVEKQESRKAGKPESRKAGKQDRKKAEKQKSRKAGKQIVALSQHGRGTMGERVPPYSALHKNPRFLNADIPNLSPSIRSQDPTFCTVSSKKCTMEG